MKADKTFDAQAAIDYIKENAGSDLNLWKGLRGVALRAGAADAARCAGECLAALSAQGQAGGKGGIDVQAAMDFIGENAASPELVCKALRRVAQKAGPGEALQCFGYLLDCLTSVPAPKAAQQPPAAEKPAENGKAAAAPPAGQQQSGGEAKPALPVFGMHELTV